MARQLLFALGALAVASSLDQEASDCMACSGETDKQCLASLTSSLDALGDKDRLSFLRAVFTGSFQMASQLRQNNVDSQSTCASLGDRECLAALDSEFAALADKYRLAYLVESCNELQHYSAFAATVSEAAGGRGVWVLGGALGLAPVGGAAAAKRRTASAYARVAGDDGIEI